MRNIIRFSFLLAVEIIVLTNAFRGISYARNEELRLTDVYFSSTKTGWIVGSKGSSPVVLRTLNSGKSWQPKLQGMFVNRIRFANTRIGWAVGAGGLILATLDGGETWTRQHRASSERLRDIFVIDNKHVWVSSANSGILLSTGDGGQTWTAHNVGLDIGLSGVAFVGHERGWAVGYGTILSTQDGGANWQAKPSGDSKQLLSVTFINEKTGWITTAGSTILRTMDGGRTWHEVVIPGIGVVVSMSGIDSTHAWAAISTGEVGDVAHIPGIERLSSDSSVLSSVDGGISWQVTLHLKSRRDHRAWIYNMYFLDGCSGWAVGGGGLFLKTIDGGKHWKKAFITLD